VVYTLLYGDVVLKWYFVVVVVDWQCVRDVVLSVWSWSEIMQAAAYISRVVTTLAGLVCPAKSTSIIASSK